MRLLGPAGWYGKKWILPSRLVFTDHWQGQSRFCMDDCAFGKIHLAVTHALSVQVPPPTGILPSVLL